MKLRSKNFLITDAQGNDIDPNDHDIIIIRNGELTDIRLHHVFSDMELHENKIYGNSLLSYFNLQDGKLVVEGSTIEFALVANNERIPITWIKRPAINDDTIISFEEIVKFSELFKVAKPDEVFTDMNHEEKQVFVDQRNERSAAQKKADEAAAQAEAERLQAETEKANAEKEEQAQKAKQAEAELKASIDPKFVHSKKDYLSTQAFYRGIDFKEYIDGPYHLFAGKSEDESPLVLIKRGADWWEEPTDTEISDKSDKTITIEFTDGEILKNITLNTDTGETTLTDAVASE